MCMFKIFNAWTMKNIVIVMHVISAINIIEIWHCQIVISKEKHSDELVPTASRLIKTLLFFHSIFTKHVNISWCEGLIQLHLLWVYPSLSAVLHIYNPPGFALLLTIVQPYRATTVRLYSMCLVFVSPFLRQMSQSFNISINQNNDVGNYASSYVWRVAGWKKSQFSEQLAWTIKNQAHFSQTIKRWKIFWKRTNPR